MNTIERIKMVKAMEFIARNISVNGTPNHLLVNKVLDYSKWHLMAYTMLVIKECERRGYQLDRRLFFRWFDEWDDGTIKSGDLTIPEIYSGWHNERYFVQCFMNLREKYDCGGISAEEWTKIEQLTRRKK